MRRVYALFLGVCFLLVGCVSVEINDVLPLNTVYSDIVVEIQPTTLGGPDENVLEELRTLLDYYKFCRRDHIHFIIRDPVVITRTSWTYADIRQFEKDHRTLFDLNLNDRNIIVFISYLPGGSIEPNRENIIGLQYSSTSIAYFQPKRELLTLIHEFGHLAGLVDRNRRVDPPVNPDRPKHCNDKRCIMFWIQPQMLGKVEFCHKCVQDLERLILGSH